MNSPARCLQRLSAVSATGRHKACVPVVQKLVGVVAPIRAGCAAMRSHFKTKHKQAEYSFKKPISRTTPVCDFLQQLCDQIAKALPVPPFNHLLFLLLSMPVIWLVCRAISSGK